MTPLVRREPISRRASSASAFDDRVVRPSTSLQSRPGACRVYPTRDDGWLAGSRNREGSTKFIHWHLPGNNDSAGKYFSGKRRNGSKWLRIAPHRVSQGCVSHRTRILPRNTLALKDVTAIRKPPSQLHNRSSSSSIICMNDVSRTQNSAAIRS